MITNSISIKNSNTFMLALNGVLLKTDIVMAINIHIPSIENIFLKSNIHNMCCHHIESLMLKLSNHFEKTPNITPNRNIKNVFSILFLVFILLSGVLILFKVSLISLYLCLNYKPLDMLLFFLFPCLPYYHQ